MTAASFLRAGAGTPLVFLHGIGGAGRIWQPQIDRFAPRGYDVVAWDLPGYAGQAPLRATDFEELSEALEALIADLALDRPILVGHSLGGMIVQTFLRRNPAGARAAVLSGTSPAFGNPEGDFQRRFVADRLGPLEDGRSMAEIAPGIVDQMVAQRADPEGVALAVSCMAATPAETYRAMVQALVRFDERAALAAIGVPTLCLAGEMDRNAPAAMMEKMATRIPGADYVCLEGVGHLANVEDAARFDAALQTFFDSHEDTRGRPA